MIHEDSEILHKSLQLIDDKRNDVFIHIDAKSNSDFKETLQQYLKESRLYFVENPVKVYWGHYSLILAEYSLFEQALSTGYYRYFHLLSGNDMPIKSQEYIHSFFDENDGKEFIGFSDKYFLGNIECIHLFPTEYRGGNGIARSCFVKVQKLLHFSVAGFKHPVFKRGAEWVSVTNDFVQYLLKQKEYYKRFKYSYCLDECYKQTVAYNSPFKERLYSIDDEFKGCMRLIDWNRGTPYTFQLADFDEIINSDRLFCRKINDAKLAQKIYDYINK